MAVNQAIFWFKLPYLFFDVGIAYLLSLLFKDQKRKRLAAGLWLINPVAIYTSFMMGQFDVVPTMMVVAGLVLIARFGRRELGVVAIGLGAAYKMYPLLLLPLVVFYVGKGLVEKLKLFILGVLPYFLTILPFLKYPAFQKYCLFSNQSQKMLSMRINVFGQQEMLVFVVF